MGARRSKEQNLVIRGQTNFQFQPSIFIRTHNGTLSVAMCVCNPNRCPLESIAETA